MNKKVSTLLTVAMVLGGSLLTSSAFAETIEGLVGNTTETQNFSDEGANGAQYVMVQTINSQKWVYGFEEKADGTIQQIVAEYNVDNQYTDEDLAKFAWTITEDNVAGTYFYTFKNKLGNLEVVVKDGAFVVNTTHATGGDAKFIFDGAQPFNGNQNYFATSTKVGSVHGYARMHNDGATPINDAIMFDLGQAPSATDLQFFKIGKKGIDDELNGLYNKKGFNFDVKTPTGVTVDNIFAASNKQIKAIKVTTNVYVAGDQETGFPAGTYFTVARPEGKEYNDNASAEEKYNYLKSCTFIAVSSTDCAEVTPAARATGEGFKLIEIPGSDAKLNLYFGTALNKISKGDEVSIKNACFEVETNLSDYPFSIDIKGFRYKKEEAADKTEHGTADVALQVINYASNSYALATKPGEDVFAFKYAQSSIVNVLDLLEENRTAAVYNIKFVSGDNDESENGKYLTFGTTDNVNHDWVAKGEALSNAALATPAYQFVITKANPTTNEVTFTNRESGRSFTTQLFKEGDVYSMAVSSQDEDFRVANVNLNNYEVTLGDNVKFNNAQIVLTKSVVDEHAGFLNEEEGKMVTLNFGRDVNNTSNRLYAYVDENDKLEVNNHANVTSEFSEAALWRLVRVKNADKTVKEAKFERSFAYKLNGSVQTEPFGDVVSMPIYQLEYIDDADETGKYLVQAGTGYALSSTATNFIVRLNSDGSVDLMGEASAVETSDEMQMISTSNGLKVSTTLAGAYDFEKQYTYAVKEAATSIKTYLGETSPIKSWKAETGHVSLQTQNGNYISMNENRDGIVVANEPEVYYLHVADKDAIVPSFYISRGMGEGSNAASERMFLFNPVDSAKYYVGPGEYDRNYAWDKDHNKALFKTGRLNATADTLTMTVKGVDSKKVAMKADNKGVWGGLNRFKFQIVESPEEDGYYYIRQTKASENNETLYLSNIGDKLTWTNAEAGSINRLLIAVEDAQAPTSNESVSASEVKVVANNGSIVVKNAAGKNVVVSTILGQVVANEVLTSDNATINVPAGIVVVAVEGESFKVNVK